MLDLCQKSPRRAQRSNVLSCRFFVRLDSQESHTTHYDREPDNGVVSSGNRDHPQCHATRSCASLRGCNPDVRQLSIPSGATLCFGLKTIAKSDPIPRPTKRNVIAEYKSYSLSYLAPSISTSFPLFPPCALAKCGAANTLWAARTVPLCQSPCFLPIQDPH